MIREQVMTIRCFLCHNIGEFRFTLEKRCIFICNIMDSGFINILNEEENMKGENRYEKSEDYYRFLF